MMLLGFGIVSKFSLCSRKKRCFHSAATSFFIFLGNRYKRSCIIGLTLQKWGTFGEA